MSGKEGVSILIYGESGIGKSTDVGYALRKAAWLLTEPGGLIPVIRCIGYTPSIIHTLFDSKDPEGELRRAINREILPGIHSGEIRTVVLDTGSEIASRMEGAFGRRFTHGQQVYREIADVFVDIINILTTQGIWFVMICHEVPPELDKLGKKLRGGPLLPGKKLPRRVPPKFDMVLRATVKEGALVEDHERIYECNPLVMDYITKDRFGVTLPEQPMELAPIIWRIKNPGTPVPEQLLSKKLNFAV